MTNKEAIEKFKKIKRGNIFLIHQRIEGKEVIEDYSLCDMAISALQAQDLQSTCNQLATDCISRQAAIEGLPPAQLGTNLAEVGTRAVRGYPIDADALMAKVAEEYGERARDALYRIIRYMPSAQPEQRWIPCSEKLPEDFQRVLVTIVNYEGNKVIRVAEYHNWKGAFQIKENHEQWKVGEKGLLAWCELPKPYRGEGE